MNFYKYDRVNDIPGDRLSYESILVRPKNETDKIILDVSAHHILFPAEGICVGIEIINPGAKDPKNLMYVTSPSLIETHDKKALTWSRFRGKKWNKNDRKSVFKNRLYSNILLQLKVQYRK